MFSSIRTRLLLSNLLLLAVVIPGVLLTFFVATGSQPAPPRSTYQRLSGIVQGSELIRLAFQLGPAQPDGSLATDLSAFGEFAETRQVRVMVVNEDEELLVWDSEAEADEGLERLVLEIDRSYRLPPRQREIFPLDPMFGRFFDSQAEWLFAGIRVNVLPRNISFAIIVADPRPTQTLRGLLAELGTAWLRPLMIAIGIGLLISVGLSWLMSRTIAQPLQALGDAADAVAQGHLGRRVPVKGPQEMRAVAEAFNTMSGEVRKTHESQRNFMANVTHDLKTPLTSIQGYSQAIMDGTARKPAMAAGIIHDEAERLTRMVAELTDLARMQAGQLQMHMEPLDLGQIVEAVSQNLRVVADSKSIRLDTHVRPIPPVTGDGDRLVQALNNLIGNAIKYTPDGGVVRVRAYPGDGGAQIVVQDTGIGIPRGELSRIFERFYQVDKARGPSRGTGLGLAITHEIVAAHNGTIHVESEDGNGTSFTVWLPGVDGA